MGEGGGKTVDPVPDRVIIGIVIGKGDAVLFLSNEIGVNVNCADMDIVF